MYQKVIELTFLPTSPPPRPTLYLQRVLRSISIFTGTCEVWLLLRVPWRPRPLTESPLGQMSASSPKFMVPSCCSSRHGSESSPPLFWETLKGRKSPVKFQDVQNLGQISFSKREKNPCSSLGLSLTALCGECGESGGSRGRGSA